MKQSRSGEAERLRQWCTVVGRAAKRIVPGATLGEMLEMTATRAFERGHVRGLRMLQRDTLEWLRGFDPEIRAAFDRELQDHFGEGLGQAGRERAKAIAAVIRRGHIETEDEFRLLEERADEIHARPAKKKELNTINALLAGYVRMRR